MTTMTTSRQTKQDKEPAAIGELLVNARDSGVITQEELAAVLCVDLRTLQRWEKGESVPQAPYARRIAGYLGLENGSLARAIRAQRAAVRENTGDSGT